MNVIDTGNFWKVYYEVLIKEEGPSYHMRELAQTSYLLSNTQVAKSKGINIRA